jgi:flagellar hook assembly protein FlgD
MNKNVSCSGKQGKIEGIKREYEWEGKEKEKEQEREIEKNMKINKVMGEKRMNSEREGGDEVEESEMKR